MKRQRWAEKIFLVIFLVFFFCIRSESQENVSSKFSFALTRKALQNSDFDTAIYHFKPIKDAYPEDINVVELYDQLVLILISGFPNDSERDELLKLLNLLEKKYIQPSAPKTISRKKDQTPLKVEPAPELAEDDHTATRPEPEPPPAGEMTQVEKSWWTDFKERLYGRKYLFYLNKQKPIEQLIQEREEEIESFEVDLDDKLWATQPKTEISVKVGQSVLVRGNNIERFLNTRPELLNVKRIDQNTLEVSSHAISAVPVYLWDGRGRWMVHFKGFSRSSLYRKLTKDQEALLDIKQNDSFKFHYSSYGNLRYRGASVSKLERTGSRSLHALSMLGPTPYGMLDSAIEWGFDGATNKLTYYTVGLTDGDIGKLEDFNLRLFDFSVNQSAHLFGYTGLRGIYFDKTFFNERFKATVFSGKERSNSVISLSQEDSDRNVQYQGALFDFFDAAEGRYSLHLIERSGDEIFGATDAAYGIDFSKKFGRFLLGGELATDQEDLAKVFNINYRVDNFSTNLHLYDIDTDYDGISGAPGDQGRVGVRWDSAYLRLNGFDVNFSTNIYQERTFSLEDRKDELNFENVFNFRAPINETLSFSSSTLYNDFGGSFSPGAYLNNSNILNKSYVVMGKHLDAFVSAGYSQNRNDIESSADYNRYTYGTGYNLQISDRLIWGANYQYNIQEDLGTGLESNPSSLTTSLNYNRRVNDRVKAGWRVSYKKELSASESPNFVQANDRISLSASLGYKPAPEVETFIQGEINQDIDSTDEEDTEVNIKWGVKAAWDSLVSWSPKGIVEGAVYKDINANGRQDINEPGISGLKVQVGNTILITDEEGRFATMIRAKRVRVALINENFPAGYNFSDAFVRNIDIAPNAIHTAFFALSSSTAILGQVFLDENDNGVFDREEQGFSNVRISLDGESQPTDYKGSFFFAQLTGGEHKLRIDVNSLPADYLPKVKIQQTINIIEGETTVINIPLKVNLKVQENEIEDNEAEKL